MKDEIHIDYTGFTVFDFWSNDPTGAIMGDISDEILEHTNFLLFGSGPINVKVDVNDPFVMYYLYNAKRKARPGIINFKFCYNIWCSAWQMNR